MKMDERFSPRARLLLFQTIELLRKEIQPRFSDWKDADDWLFSELDFTKEELAQIYKGRDVMYYDGSAVDLEAAAQTGARHASIERLIGRSLFSDEAQVVIDDLRVMLGVDALGINESFDTDAERQDMVRYVERVIREYHLEEDERNLKDGYHPDVVPSDPWFSASEVKDTAWYKIEHAVDPDVPDDVFNSTAASFKITPKYNLVVWCDIAGEEESGQESRYFIVSIRENLDNDSFGDDIGAEWATADLSRRELEIAIDHCLEMDRANIREVSGKLVDDSQPQYGRRVPLDYVIAEAQEQSAEKKTWAEERAEELSQKPRSEWTEDDWDAHVYIEQLRAESDYIDGLDDR